MVTHVRTHSELNQAKLLQFHTLRFYPFIHSLIPTYPFQGHRELGPTHIGCEVGCTMDMLAVYYSADTCLHLAVTCVFVDPIASGQLKEQCECTLNALMMH